MESKCNMAHLWHFQYGNSVLKIKNPCDYRLVHFLSLILNVVFILKCFHFLWKLNRGIINIFVPKLGALNFIIKYFKLKLMWLLKINPHFLMIITLLYMRNQLCFFSWPIKSRSYLKSLHGILGARLVIWMLHLFNYT